MFFGQFHGLCYRAGVGPEQGPSRAGVRQRTNPPAGSSSVMAQRFAATYPAAGQGATEAVFRDHWCRFCQEGVNGGKWFMLLCIWSLSPHGWGCRPPLHHPPWFPWLRSLSCLSLIAAHPGQQKSNDDFRTLELCIFEQNFYQLYQLHQEDSG